MEQIRPFEDADFERAQVLLSWVQAFHMQNRPDLYASAPGFSVREHYGRALHAPELLSAVAEREDGTLSGVCLASVEECRPGQNILLTPRRFACVEVLCVDQACRGRGVGTRLMEYVRARAETLGLERLELSVSAFNQAARRLYKALGYRDRSYKMEFKLN